MLMVLFNLHYKEGGSSCVFCLKKPQTPKSHYLWVPAVKRGTARCSTSPFQNFKCKPCAPCARPSLRTHLISSSPHCSTHPGVVWGSCFFCSPCPDPEAAAGCRGPSLPGHSLQLLHAEKTQPLASPRQRGQLCNPQTA